MHITVMSRITVTANKTLSTMFLPPAFIIYIDNEYQRSYPLGVRWISPPDPIKDFIRLSEVIIYRSDKLDDRDQQEDNAFGANLLLFLFLLFAH